jgi:hypothetical protein
MDGVGTSGRDRRGPDHASELEEEIRAFLRHRFEQLPETQRFLVNKEPAEDWSQALPAIQGMIQAQNEALL